MCSNYYCHLFFYFLSAAGGIHLVPVNSNNGQVDLQIMLEPPEPKPVKKTPTYTKTGNNN